MHDPVQAGEQEGMQWHVVTRKEALSCFRAIGLSRGVLAESTAWTIGKGLGAIIVNPGWLAVCRLHHPRATQYC